jgi:PKD repeat protein
MNATSRARMIAIVVLTLLSASCGGSGSRTNVGGGVGSSHATLYAMNGSGTALPSTAARLDPTPDGYAIYALDTKAVWFSLSYDSTLHVAQVDRGEYFSSSDLYLSVSDLPGRVDIGGYRFGKTTLCAAGASTLGGAGLLVARVVLADGALRGVRSNLPTAPGCTPLGFGYSDNGDGTARFNWTYHNSGDYNQDGEVNISDLTPIGINYGKNPTAADWSIAALADGDSNTEINLADITPIGQHYLTLVSGYALEKSGTENGTYSPSTTLALAAGTKDPVLNFTYSDPTSADGEWYRVRAYSAEDASGGVSSDPVQLDLLPPGNPPVAAFTSAPTTLLAGESVQFTDTSTGAATWAWTFGDGGTSQLPSPGHIYASAGSFTAKLTVTNAYGSDSFQQTITVDPQPVPDNPADTFVAVSSATLNGAGTAFTILSSDLPDNSDILFGPLTQGGPPVNNNLNLNYPYRGGLNEPATPHPDISHALGVVGMTCAGLCIYTPSNASTITVNATQWTYDANSARINGEDSYGGHASPVNGGQYHYHDVAFITNNSWVGVENYIGDYDYADGHSKLVGWAEDGYPIYGPYGYVDPLDAGSGVTRMTPSWQATDTGANRPADVSTTAASASNNSKYIILPSDPGGMGANPGMRLTLVNGVPPAQEVWIMNQANITYVGGGHPPYMGPNNGVEISSTVTIPSGATLKFEFLPGVFIEDELFVGGGTLDRYNGRWGVTPDFPGGTYAYFCTMDASGKGLYPYMIGPELYGSLSVGTTPGTGYVKPAG